MSAIARAKELTRLLKLKKADLYDEAAAMLRRNEELELEVHNLKNANRDLEIRAMAAESVARLNKVWWREAQVATHRAKLNYHSIALEKAERLAEEARCESMGKPLEAPSE